MLELEAKKRGKLRSEREWGGIRGRFETQFCGEVGGNGHEGGKKVRQGVPSRDRKQQGRYIAEDRS